MIFGSTIRRRMEMDKCNDKLNVDLCGSSDDFYWRGSFLAGRTAFDWAFVVARAPERDVGE